MALTERNSLTHTHTHTPTNIHNTVKCYQGGTKATSHTLQRGTGLLWKCWLRWREVCVCVCVWVCVSPLLLFNILKLWQS